MASRKKQTQTISDIENTLWQAADKLRANMDAAEYKHVILGLIFLKYISDRFDEFRQELKAKLSKEEIKTELEDRDHYIAENVFWVPKKARWFGDTLTHSRGLQDDAKQADIGKRIDEAMVAIEKENPKLKNVLPKDFARRQPNIRLGELIDLISMIGFNNSQSQPADALGHVYEYFLGQFASAEGKKGGQFYTAKSVVNLIVECLEPYEGRIYDPAMGSGGFFVSSEKFIQSHADRKHVIEAKNKISICGQESNPTTWRLSAMNMAIRGLDFNFGKEPADTFHKNQHPSLKADFIMANPPFNVKDWGASVLEKDQRWKYGMPPERNANFAWVQHMIHHLSHRGYAGIVLANGSMSSTTSSEGEIRKNLIKAKLVDCMIALPGQLFFSTQIPVCIWILARDRTGKKDGKRSRENETLFIDARNMGRMISRSQKELSKEDIQKIAGTYHQWRSKEGGYKDMAGFCKSATLADIQSHEYVLTPGRYVGIPERVEDEASFAEKMAQFTSELKEQFKEGKRLEKQIQSNLSALGFWKHEP